MMARVLYKPYPTVKVADIENEWSFMDDKGQRLSTEDLCLLYVDDREFNSEEQDLYISCQLKVKGVAELFALGMSAVVPASARIGACIRWYSQSSRQRCVGEAVYFDSSSSGALSLSCFIPANTLRGRVEFDFILFLAAGDSSGPLNPDGNAKVISLEQIPIAHSQYATALGSILLQSAPQSIRVDGKGSLFPVFYVQEMGQPLWWLNLNIDDPVEQPLEMDTVSLYINTSHPDYEKICCAHSKEITYTPMLKQIYASAFMHLLIKLRSTPEWWDAVKNYSGPFNTLCGLANYGSKYVWGDIDPLTDPNKMFVKIMSILDEKLATIGVVR
jgi:hypothetical protein